MLKAGYVLAVAGEGRLSDREGAIVPLQDGPAFFALRAGAPIVPMAIIGGRWLRFGKTLTMRVGPVVELAGRRADREGVVSLTAELQQAMESLLVGHRGGSAARPVRPLDDGPAGRTTVAARGAARIELRAR